MYFHRMMEYERKKRKTQRIENRKKTKDEKGEGSEKRRECWKHEPSDSSIRVINNMEIETLSLSCHYALISRIIVAMFAFHCVLLQFSSFDCRKPLLPIHNKYSQYTCTQNTILTTMEIIQSSHITQKHSYDLLYHSQTHTHKVQKTSMQFESFYNIKTC